MLQKEKNGLPSSRKKVVIIAAVLWTALVAVSCYWNWMMVGKSIITLAESEARSSFNKDVVYRRWAALQGGVYVPPIASSAFWDFSDYGSETGCWRVRKKTSGQVTSGFIKSSNFCPMPPS